jgi:AcrR family transcriptional regulator
VKVRMANPFRSNPTFNVIVTALQYDRPMPRAKQRTPELREKVLQVAVEMLINQGVAGFTTRRVAEGADTSPPAVYELFGDKAGLVREVFFEGFRMLQRQLKQLDRSDDPRADLVTVIYVLRAFTRDNSALAGLMFSRPFADFDPGVEERKAGTTVREFIVDRVGRCIDKGIITGQATDTAHVLLALAQGLALQETAGWLGTSRASMDRRWNLAIEAVLDGLHPDPPAGGATTTNQSESDEGQ